MYQINHKKVFTSFDNIRIYYASDDSMQFIQVDNVGLETIKYIEFSGGANFDDIIKHLLCVYPDAPSSLEDDIYSYLVDLLTCEIIMEV